MPSARRRSATRRSSSRSRSLDTDTTLFHQRPRSQATATTKAAAAPASAPTVGCQPTAIDATPPARVGGARSADHPTAFSSTIRNGPPRIPLKTENADGRHRQTGPGPYSNQPPPLRTLPIVPRQADQLLPRIVHTVPVIICECCPILLPMNDPVGLLAAGRGRGVTLAAARGCVLLHGARDDGIGGRGRACGGALPGCSGGAGGDRARVSAGARARRNSGDGSGRLER